MHRQSGVLLVLVVGFVLCSVDGSRAGAPSLLRVKGFMTPVQFTECGLTKLSDTELAKLDAWLSDYTLAVFQVASSQNAPQPTPGQQRLAPSVPPKAGSSLEFKDLEGAVIVASDGQFLGKITTNKYDSDSIANKFGAYGNKYSADSILNKYGTYGGEYSISSPFNRFSSSSPVIYSGKQAVAYLTVNSALSPRVDPNALLGWLKAEH